MQRRTLVVIQQHGHINLSITARLTACQWPVVAPGCRERRAWRRTSLGALRRLTGCRTGRKDGHRAAWQAVQGHMQPAPVVPPTPALVPGNPLCGGHASNLSSKQPPPYTSCDTMRRHLAPCDTMHAMHSSCEPDQTAGRRDGRAAISETNNKGTQHQNQQQKRPWPAKFPNHAQHPKPTNKRTLNTIKQPAPKTVAAVREPKNYP